MRELFFSGHPRNYQGQLESRAYDDDNELKHAAKNVTGSFAYPCLSKVQPCSFPFIFFGGYRLN